MGKVIGIVGTRSRNSGDDLRLVRRAFLQVYEEGDQIVSGGCPRGADRFAEIIAKQRQVPIKIWYAPWRARGRSAGHWRNSFIAEDADILIACVAGDRTGGTEDTIKKFKKAHPNGLLVLV